MAAGFEELAFQEAERLIGEAAASGAEALDLSSLRITALPESIRGLDRLRRLDLSKCRYLEDFSPLATLGGLEELSLSGCPRLRETSAVSALAGLRSLDLSQCQLLSDLSGLAPLSALSHLNLGECRGVTELGAVAGLSGLRRLQLNSCQTLHSLEDLARLTGLQELGLGFCTQFDDLTPLAGLADLRHVDLTFLMSLQDVDALLGARQLSTLKLGWCRELGDAAVLARWPWLQHLDLSGCDEAYVQTALPRLGGLKTLSARFVSGLRSLDAVAGLSELEELDVSGGDELSDVTALAALTTLRNLNLRSCDQLGIVDNLGALTALESLSIDAAALREFDQLRPLGSLRHLFIGSRDGRPRPWETLSHFQPLETLQLQGLADRQDLGFIARLTNLVNLLLDRCPCLNDLGALGGLGDLESLYLAHCPRLTDVSPIAGLPELRVLGLSYCDGLHDLRPLAGLARLESLEVSAKAATLDATTLGGLGRLQVLHAKGTTVDYGPRGDVLDKLTRLHTLTSDRPLGVPVEIAAPAAAAETSSCLEWVESWQRDLRAGAVTSADVKVFVLGNGRVGKTQICRRLRGEDFDATVASTHGIEIDRVELAPARATRPATIANLWDFGGQDIYLGTHSLFLDERAVYLVVWTPAQENEQEMLDAGVPMRNRPLGYWLDYVRSLAGPAAPVIVVQSQCDREEDEVDAPISADHGFARLQRTACSALNEDGMDRLVPELKSAARLLQQRYEHVLLPLSWVRIGESLRAMAGRRSIERGEFDRLCTEQHGSAVPEVVLQYLHGSGQVFWRHGVFGNQVVLDQAWALEGIYAVLMRGAALPLIRAQGGLLTRELLAALVWDAAGYPTADQQLFLSMMVQCGTCFKLTEGQYLAPELLPAGSPERGQAAAIWRGARADVRVRLAYGFLHEGVLKAVLCAIGELAGSQAAYWRYGVCFFDGERRATARLWRPEAAAGGSISRQGEVIIETAGERAADLAEHLVSSIAALRIGQPPSVHWEQGAPAGLAVPSTVDGRPTELAKPFSRLHPAAVAPAPEEAPIAHVSYAWGGESERIVDALEAALAQAGIGLRRDKSAMRPGDWISRFMMEIGHSRCVLVVLSDKYLRSAFCLRELLHLHQASLGDRAALLERIVPVVLADARIDDAVDRLAIVKHWKTRREMLEAATQGLDPLSWGATTREELLLIRDFEHRVADILAWLVDVLMPRGTVGPGSDAAATTAAVLRVQERLQAAPRPLAAQGAG